ncbi:MAG: hypothetical protein ABW223_05160 [Rariglobus sp.]
MPLVSLKTLLCLAAVLAVAPLNAAVFFSDTFDSGIGSWVGATGVTASLNTSNVLGTGNSLNGTTGNNSVNVLALGFTSQTLSTVGDSLTVAFDYRWSGATAGATDRVPAFGLYNSNATGIYTDDVGYNVQVITSSVKLQRETGTDNTALAGNDDVSMANASAAYVYSAVSVVRFTFTLERVLTGLKLTTTLTPTGASTPDVTLTTIDTSPLTFTYDEFLLRSRATSYYLDNVSVDFTASAVPEPASAASIAGLVALGLIAYRRKSRTSV